MWVLFARGDPKVLLEVPYDVVCIYMVKSLILNLVKICSLMVGGGAEVCSIRLGKSLSIAFREWSST